MKFAPAFVLLFFGAVACAGPGGVSPSGGLMYKVPETTSVVYHTISSQDVSVEVPGMGQMDVRGASEATLALSFAPGEGGVQVTVAFEELTASLDQPMASISASESDIVGDLVFIMDEKGRSTSVTLPEMKGSAEQLVNPAGFVHNFFPRLPGGVVAPGEMWTDTIQFDIETADASGSTESVLAYTLVGDTVVDGVELLHVTFEGQTEAVTEVDNAGMAMIQAFSGDVSGMFLWDPARGLMVASQGDQDLDGTMEMAGSGMAPMPMVISGTSSVKLQGG